MQVPSLASLSGLWIWHCHGCSIGRRSGSDLVLLWLWRRLAAVTLIKPLAGKLQYASGAAVKTNKKKKQKHLVKLYTFFFLSFCLFRAAPSANGGSQAREPVGATAARLHHSHSNTGSLTHWSRPGIEPATSWFVVGFVSTAPGQALQIVHFKYVHFVVFVYTSTRL